MVGFSQLESPVSLLYQLRRWGVCWRSKCRGVQWGWRSPTVVLEEFCQEEGKGDHTFSQRVKLRRDHDIKCATPTQKAPVCWHPIHLFSRGYQPCLDVSQGKQQLMQIGAESKKSTTSVICKKDHASCHQCAKWGEKKSKNLDIIK